MSKARLYELVILWHPNEKQEEDGQKSKILVEKKTILAGDDKSALLQAARQIPEDKLDQLDQVEVAVRPF